MNPIIEAMARAHWDRAQADAWIKIPWEKVHPLDKDALSQRMRAAIRAAMESEPPVVDGRNQSLSDDPQIARYQWRALLAALLEE